MRGEDLIQYFIKLTGLPEESARAEIRKILKEQNKPVHLLCMDDLRTVLANYLREIILEAKALDTH
jgi:hypothetical protein